MALIISPASSRDQKMHVACGLKMQSFDEKGTASNKALTGYIWYAMTFCF